LLLWWALPLPLGIKVTSWLGLLALPFAAMAWRKRSVAKAVFSVVSWIYNAGGLVRGVLRRRVDPRQPLATIVLHTSP